MKLEYAGSTHVGNRRTNNEDAYVLLPGHGVVAVADGMGGYAAGEVASRMAIEALQDFFSDTEGDDEVTWPYGEEQSLSYDENRLTVAIKLANMQIYTRAHTDPDCQHMGTTVVAALFREDTVSIVHVGDSRAYRLRGQDLSQLTRDHSLREAWIEGNPGMTAEEMDAFPYKNVILRALGMQEQVEIDLLRASVKRGDVFLLCSDGLTGEVADDQIRSILDEAKGDLQAAADQLVKVACDNGGSDNVTVVLARAIP
jgi:protein phosphatase